MDRLDWDAVVIGGGFFGSYLALTLAKRLRSVLIVEQESDLLLRASYHNQARVHAGYHYPRSLMTAVRSRINFPRFVEDFAPAIVRDFDKYYAVAKPLGKVTAEQFRIFMQRVGAPLTPAPVNVRKLFDPDLIEAVYGVREYAFDAGILRGIMRERLREAGIPVEFGVRAERVRAADPYELTLECTRAGEVLPLRARWVFNCTYSEINRLRHQSGLELIPLKHELVEMALVELPPALEGISVTVMCGPFFSIVPFPDRQLSTLSHVRYTPHHSWRDLPGQPYFNAREHLHQLEKRSNCPLMIRDAARYLPAMARCQQRDSLWEVKTVLPQSELDDGRPILFHRDPLLAGLVTVMGGKLDNIYDLPPDLDALGLVAGHSAKV